MPKNGRLFVFPILSALFIIILPSCSFTNPFELTENIIHSGTITDRTISEASGIAVSGINKDILWVVNDSGNAAAVFGVNPKGELLVTVNVEGVENIDWEDLSSFEDDGKHYILIADVGDNKAKRKECYLHILQEPELNEISNTSVLSVKPSRSIAFTYEDGPRDCESVAVDVAGETILLLSKRDRPPVLYELPLTNQPRMVAKRLEEINPLPQPTPDKQRPKEYLKYAALPTSMDISHDGLSVIVLTYTNAYYYRRDNQSDWLSVFSSRPKEIPLPFLNQAESVCFGGSGASIYVTTEKVPAPLLEVDLMNGMGKPIKVE